MIITKQEIILSRKIVYPTRLLSHCKKDFLKRNKIKVFVAPKMTYIITFLDNNVKLAVHTAENIHGIYPYIKMIGTTIKFTTSGHLYHHFDSSSSTNNDTSTLHPVIAAIRI